MKKLTIKELFSESDYPDKFGIFVFGKLHDTASDILIADATANNLRAINPKWKIEVHPIDEFGNILTTNVDGSLNEEKSNTQPQNRMVELIESFETTNEIIKKDKKKDVDEEKIKQETERLKQIALNEANQLNYWTGNVPTVLGKGQTINTAFDPKNTTPGTTINTAFNNPTTANISFNPNSNKPYNPNYTYLQPAEAVRLAISRTLNSGAPVNNLGFYEEVNRELNILGFNSKSPLDIKQALLKLIMD